MWLIFLNPFYSCVFGILYFLCKPFFGCVYECWTLFCWGIRSSSTSPTLLIRVTLFSFAGRTPRWRNAPNSCRRWWLKWLVHHNVLWGKIIFSNVWLPLLTCCASFRWRTVFLCQFPSSSNSTRTSLEKEEQILRRYHGEIELQPTIITLTCVLTFPWMCLSFATFPDSWGN